MRSAGFCIGAAERGTLLSPGQPAVGGYCHRSSVLWHPFEWFFTCSKIIENSGATLDSSAPFESDADQLGAALMTPTRIYRKQLLPL